MSEIWAWPGWVLCSGQVPGRGLGLGPGSQLVFRDHVQAHWLLADYFLAPVGLRSPFFLELEAGDCCPNLEAPLSSRHVAPGGRHDTVTLSKASRSLSFPSHPAPENDISRAHDWVGMPGKLRTLGSAGSGP